MQRVLVVGSNGWVASRLIQILKERFPKIFIRGFDIQPCAWGTKVDDFVQGDISNLQSVLAATATMDTVFHVAAIVMGPRMNDHFLFLTIKAELLQKVNVGGVQNVLEGCKKNGVLRMIYTSSASVVYNGEHIKDATEDLPYCKAGLGRRIPLNLVHLF